MGLIDWLVKRHQKHLREVGTARHVEQKTYAPCTTERQSRGGSTSHRELKEKIQ